jgi:hypothetical protein
VLIAIVAVLTGVLGATPEILTEVIPPKLRDKLGFSGFRGLTGSARTLEVGKGGNIKR